MSLPRGYSYAQSEFNDFLFAYLDDVEGGQRLTVLSAMARLGLDPWEEAARLSKMPAKTATRTLAGILAGIPEKDGSEPDWTAIAGNLVGRLTNRATPQDPPQPAEVPNELWQAKQLLTNKWVMWGVLAAVALFTLWR